MAEPEQQPDNRMSDVEALMWNLEKDPHLSAAFSNVTIFDQPPDYDRLRARLLQASRAVPRLRQKVVAALGRLAPPEWRDDPDFDIDFHLRRVVLPAPGTERELFALAAQLAARPFDRTRPLWEFTVVDGLADGRGAMVQKLHHTITDGEGGVRMSVQFIDLERDPDQPLAPAPDPDDVDTSVPEQRRSLLDTAADTLAHDLRRGAGVGLRSLQAAGSLLSHPDRILSLPTDAAAVAQSLTRQVVVSDHRHSPLWTERSLRRSFDVLRVPLDDARVAAKSLGGSVNDLFVTAAAGGAGAYHRAAGAPVDELRISMPVSTRTSGSKGGNSFVPTRVLVPVGADPAERFAEITRRLSSTKGERALGITHLMAGLVNVLPTSVLIRVARAQVDTVDFATSNVRGAPWDLYIAGARIEANYPLGPMGGTAFNLTTLSTSGSLDMGLHMDAAAITDPGLLLNCMQDAFGELLELGRPRRKRKRS